MVWFDGISRGVVFCLYVVSLIMGFMGIFSASLTLLALTWFSGSYDR